MTPSLQGSSPVTTKRNAQREALTGRPDSQFAGQHIHFIGIGGCGMSGLALMLRQLGAVCCGSDSVGSDLTSALTDAGITVSLDQRAEALPTRCDLVIASAAINPDHPEMLAAWQRGIRVWSYAQALGRAQAGMTGVSIAGTHGKSTTTAMLAHVLIECGLDPSFIVGATCPQIGGGNRVGSNTMPKGPLANLPGAFLAEACEFNRSFHHPRPTIGLINNIEAAHPDIYGSLDEIIKAFRGFAELIPPAEQGGRLLIAHDGAHRGTISPGLKCNVETFGFHPEADYQVVYDAAAQRVGVSQDGVWLGQ